MNTLDLELRKSKTHPDGYEVELLRPSTNQSPVIEPFVIPYDADKPETQTLLDSLDFDKYSKMLGVSLKEKPQILKEDIGISLFAALFTGQLFDYYKNLLNSSTRLNIRLHTTEPRLLNIPWEYMYDNKIVKDFLTISSKFNISLIRLLKSDSQSNFSGFAMPTALPLKVLVVISKPRHSSLHFEERIEKAWLDNLSEKTTKLLEVDYIENPASFSKLEEKLTENSYDILHFLGHGELKDENGFLLFEDNNEIHNRETDPVIGERLAKALANQNRLRLVFLNSCLTGRNLGKPFSSVATSLLKSSHVLSIVAMQFKIADEVGSAFAARFYHNLSVGKTIDEAISAARRSVYSKGWGKKSNKEIYKTQWGIPVCYTQYDKPLRLVKGQKEELIREAKDLESKERFEQAIEKWEEIRSIDPNEPRIDSEIQQLTAKQQQNEKINQIIGKLALPLYKQPTLLHEIQQWLKNKTEAVDRILELANELAEEDISVKKFKKEWEKLKADFFSNNAIPEIGCNLPVLFERIKRGEIVLFLGSDMSKLPPDDNPFTKTLIQELIQNLDYQDFNESLPMIAEYYPMTAYGRIGLVNRLCDCLNTAEPSTPLYQSLANIEEPLIVISAAYDNLLENAFKASRKKYIIVFPIVSDIPGVECSIGHLLVKYSDKDKFESSCLIDDLSPLIKDNYSIIYKVRGNSKLENSLIISEDNYFTFATHTQRLIPNYLVNQCNKHGLLFLGYTPKQWNDRLIVNAILKRRHYPLQNRSYIIKKEVDNFEKGYWNQHGVDIYPVELSQFAKQLDNAN